jgi:hypothetical protein
VIYSKKDDLLKHYSFVLDSKYGFRYSRMISIENGNNCIAFVIDPDFFCYIKEEIERGNDISITPEILPLIENIKSDDNPLLMICKMR